MISTVSRLTKTTLLAFAFISYEFPFMTEIVLLMLVRLIGNHNSLQTTNFKFIRCFDTDSDHDLITYLKVFKVLDLSRLRCKKIQPAPSRIPRTLYTTTHTVFPYNTLSCSFRVGAPSSFLNAHDARTVHLSCTNFWRVSFGVYESCAHARSAGRSTYAVCPLYPHGIASCA